MSAEVRPSANPGPSPYAQDGYTELLGFLRSEEVQAQDTLLDEQRAAAISYYIGDLYGDEQEGRSSLVTREVAMTVDFDLISILRTITSSDSVVTFETHDPATAQFADDAGRLIHYTLMRKQDGYRILHDWIKLGELEKTGVVKAWIDQQYKTVQVDVPQEAFQPDEQGNPSIDGNPIVGEPALISGGDPVDDGTGAVSFHPGTLEVVRTPEIYRTTVKQPLPPKFCVAAVPNEEFQTSQDTVELDPSPYLCHSQRKTLSELHKMGFEFDDDALWGSAIEAQIVAAARDSQRSGRQYESVRRGPMRKVWFREEYCFYDWDGDGIAERIFVQRVGNHVFAVQPVDEQPFEEWCPYPMPARRVGQSLFDKCGDIQRVNSVLLRQGMDSLYMSTNPRTLINEQSIGENTIDDLLTVRSGALIRWTGGVAPTPWTTAAVHADAFQGMAQMTDALEARTGISRLNQGLDADSFDRTATGTALIQTAGQTMQEYRARNFVEAFRRLCAKLYRMMRAHGVPVQIMVDGQPRTIDPKQWPEEIDIRVNVGLGTNSADKKIAYLSQIVESQNEAKQQGSPLVTDDNMYNATTDLITAMNVGPAANYITKPPEVDPNAPPQPQPPSPEAIKAQSDAQIAATQAQSAHEQAMGKLTLQQQAQQSSTALSAQAANQDLMQKREQAALNAQLAREKAEFEANLAQQTADRNYGLDIQRQDREYELKREEQQHRIALGSTSVSGGDIPQNKPGGDLSA